MVNLRKHFIKKIKFHGPISISQYMADSILAPKIGYYSKQNSIGKQGDFITGPEISQMYGELIGVFLTECWRINNDGAPVNLVDLGGGNGTMMKDSLRTIKKIEPNFYKTINTFFIETSPLLQRKQKASVPTSIFLDNLDKLPPGNTFFTANEFLDCLPVHQFIKVGNKWHERLIDINKHDVFIFVLSNEPSKYDFFLAKNYEEGEITEISFNLIQTVNNIAKIINKYGSLALIIDYAYQDKEPYGTLQAIKNHKKIDPLEDPENSDISCKVNFELVSKIAKEAGSVVNGPISQNKFFQNLGIHIRSEQLINNNPSKKSQITSEKNRLISKEGMGNLFKVMTINKNNFKLPPIFGDQHG